MSDDVQVVRYRPADRPAVWALLRETFAAADAERLIRQWDWKYEANPFNQDGAPYVLLLKKQAEVIGLYGGLFLRFIVGGRECVVHHGCDMSVHPAYRGAHLSKRLRNRNRTDNPLHFSWQNATSYQVVRAEKVQGVPLVSVVKPLALGYVIERASGHRWRGRRTVPEGEGALPGVRRGGWQVTEIDGFDERFDRLWQRACRDYPVMLVRDRRYLDWRFTQRPDARYRVLAATAGAEVSGYLVLRCTVKDGEPWGYVVDFLVEGRRQSVFSALLTEAVAQLRRDGAKAVGCRVTVPPYRSFFYRHGFIRYPWRSGGYIRARANLPDVALQPFGDVRQWFLTMGDGDLEMSL